MIRTFEGTGRHGHRNKDSTVRHTVRSQQSTRPTYRSIHRNVSAFIPTIFRFRSQVAMNFRHPHPRRANSSSTASTASGFAPAIGARHQTVGLDLASSRANQPARTEQSQSTNNRTRTALKSHKSWHSNPPPYYRFFQWSGSSIKYPTLNKESFIIGHLLFAIHY